MVAALAPLDTFLLFMVGILLVLFAAVTWLWRSAERDLAEADRDLADSDLALAAAEQERDVLLGWEQQEVREIVAQPAAVAAARPLLQVLPGGDQ